MKLRKLIKELQKIEKEYGDLFVFDETPCLLEKITICSDPENYPDDFNMPQRWVEFGTI